MNHDLPRAGETEKGKKGDALGNCLDEFSKRLKEIEPETGFIVAAAQLPQNNYAMRTNLSVGGFVHMYIDAYPEMIEMRGITAEMAARILRDVFLETLVEFTAKMSGEEKADVIESVKRGVDEIMEEGNGDGDNG